MSRRGREWTVTLAALAVVGAASADVANGSWRDRAYAGPSSSETAYVVPARPGVSTRSILTVGDSVNAKPDGSPYRLVGLPDGLGAFDNRDGTFTLLANHELREAAGVPRAHGAAGAFVSRWNIDRRTLRVRRGADLIERISLWDGAGYAAAATGMALSRLCSGDLAAPGAFLDRRSNTGYPGRLFLSGEEAGTEGRAFAHALDGTSYQLPALGRYSYENAVAHPGTGRRTVVIGLDDTTGGQVYVYAGEKSRTGNPAQRAGLGAGTLYGIRVDGLAAETDASSVAGGTPFAAAPLGDARNRSGEQLEADSNAAGVTRFQRPEDGAWDPTNPRAFYFVTTASFTGRSRLWRLTFADPADPAAGGRAEMLLEGDEGQRMMDNLTVDGRGDVLIQEDPGGQDLLARIWRYDARRDQLELVARHDPARFSPGAPAFVTRDEESSGIIDASGLLGHGWYLADVQAHHEHSDPELVEGGQLLALRLPGG